MDLLQLCKKYVNYTHLERCELARKGWLGISDWFNSTEDALSWFGCFCAILAGADKKNNSSEAMVFRGATWFDIEYTTFYKAVNEAYNNRELFNAVRSTLNKMDLDTKACALQAGLCMICADKEVTQSEYDMIQKLFF